MLSTVLGKTVISELHQRTESFYTTKPPQLKQLNTPKLNT